MGIQISDKVRSMRIAKGLSQSVLAKKAGIAQSTLSYIENDTKHPQFDTLSAICRALNTTVLELLAYGEDHSSKKLFEERSRVLRALASDNEIGIATQNEFEQYLYEQLMYKDAE